MSGPQAAFSDALVRQIQGIADFLYGNAHPGNSILLSEVAEAIACDEDDTAYALRKFATKEVVDFDGHRVRLLGSGKSVYEDGGITEFVLGLHYALNKYRGAVVRIVVAQISGDQAAGTGFFVNYPPNTIVTNRHVVLQRTIIRIEDERGDVITTGPLPAMVGPTDVDLAAVTCPVPSDVIPIPIDWGREATRELEDVLVLSYPDIALTRPALYPAIGKIGILGELLTGRKSLMISDVASAGSSGGPVISTKGKAIGVIAREAETQSTGSTRIFVSAIPSYYLQEVLQGA